MIDNKKQQATLVRGKALEAPIGGSAPCDASRGCDTAEYRDNVHDSGTAWPDPPSETSEHRTETVCDTESAQA
jgi:hypothetical protein